MHNLTDRLEFAACTNNIEAAAQVAKTLGGTLYCDNREKWQHLPFRALVTCTTDDLGDLAEISDVGLYVVCRRIIKPGSPKMVSLNAMVHHPDKSHQECDAYWRDNHGPLALEHHAFMTGYSQLNIIHRLSGADFDGLALCGFETESDLRDKFFTTEASVPVILNDIKNFADTKNSPTRLVAQVTSYA